jgi:RHS repeat-associated protein
MDYTRDNVGSPTSVAEQLLDSDNQTVHNATLTFGYDNANRLTQEKRSGYEPIWYEYAMDGAGNRTQFVEKDQQGTPVGTTNATYSADNRLLTYGNLTFGYDGNGNRTSKTVNQVTTTYAYNHDNRLTELHDGATLTFTYNGDGLRQSRTVNGATTRYAYDGVRLLKELDAAGATQTTYTLAPLGDEWYPLVSDRKAGATRFYAFDALGTTRALTNQSQLTTHQFTDDAYGNLLTATDPAATPHQYIGKLGYYTDAASGLQLLTERYYDPVVGRFVTEDPIKEGGNWFGYVGGNALENVDPSGTIALAAAVVGCVAGGVVNALISGWECYNICVGCCGGALAVVLLPVAVLSSPYGAIGGAVGGMIAGHLFCKLICELPAFAAPPLAAPPYPPAGPLPGATYDPFGDADNDGIPNHIDSNPTAPGDNTGPQHPH